MLDCDHRVYFYYFLSVWMAFQCAFLSKYCFLLFTEEKQCWMWYPASGARPVIACQPSVANARRHIMAREHGIGHFRTLTEEKERKKGLAQRPSLSSQTFPLPDIPEQMRNNSPIAGSTFPCTATL